MGGWRGQRGTEYRFKGRGGRNQGSSDIHPPPTPHPPISPPPPAATTSSLNAFRGYMARSDWSPSMTDRWRAEDDDRNRLARPRDRDRIDHWERSPPRRDIDSAYRGRDLFDTDSYRPPHQTDLLPDPRRSPYPRPSPSPVRQQRLPPRGRPLEDRVSRPRSPSFDRAVKRRRTQSPSPARSDRWIPDHRRSSPDRAYSGFRERASIVDRAYSPRHPSPSRNHRSEGRDHLPETDSYVPESRRLSPTPPPSRRRSNRSASPRRSLSPPSRRLVEHQFNRDHDLPSSSRSLYPKTTEASSSRRPSRPSTAGGDEDDRDSMDGNYAPRGGYSNRGNMMQNRPSRPYADTRPPYGGSPPYQQTNNSHHGPPHSSSNYHSRGNWGGYQGPHGPMNQNHSSPSYRQNSYPPQYQPNHQSYNGPHHGNQPYRGRGRGNFHPNDRRFSGPEAPTHSANYRGRGGHYNNLQWSSGKRGGPQGQNYQSHPNSVQPSPTPSQHDELPPEEENMFRPPKDFQVEDHKDARPPTAPHNQSNTPAKDSKFSFAFKSKAPAATPTKAPPDLNNKAKPPPSQPRDNRPPPTHPRKDFQDRGRPQFDRKPFPQDRKHPPSEPRPRSRSPPKKKLKSEPRPRPKLPPEFAQSESIYFRKPGDESVVGAGTYGKVFKAIHIYTRDQVALKRIRMEGERDGFPITAVREIRLLQHLRHKHVVALQEVMVEKNEAYMVFEYLSHDLTGLINHPTFKLTAAHKKDLARQMFEGLDFLHRRGVLHRDIKAANILVSSTGQLKYADFGLARFYTKSRQLDYTNRVITIWYRPPELLLGETQYGPAIDIWSACCVFMEMFTRKAVFPGEGGELSQLEKVYNMLGTPSRTEWPRIADLPWYELMQPTQQRRPRQFEETFKDILSAQAMEMAKWCFAYDPATRPSAEEVLCHPYFTSENPPPKRAVELDDVKGDWHEFESKKHRKAEEKKKKAEWDREREKRKKAEREGRKESNIKVEVEEEKVTEEAPESDGDGSARMSMS